MVKNNVTNTEDIQVKVDQNNLIYIDPNSTVDADGNVNPRNIQAEKLIMYVNLEADIVPRSILVSDNETNTLTSIASGTLNFLKNGDGQDYDTTWTDSFLNTEEKKDNKGNPTGEFFQSDKTGQSFGIDSISIEIKGFNAIPQVRINFIDVRGKTLFESPENSPYKAFFHIPWPIFYLTVKGYYGKAIKYRLHLVKFTSKFNESSGNFEVSTTFVGSTYAWLSDIPLQGILNAPYLFPNESTRTTRFNETLGLEKEELKKSSRGYEILKTVYNEYKLKGLIPKDFPVKTVREILTIASNLDSLLEKQIFDQVVDMRLFAATKEFGETIDEYEKSVRSWASSNLINTPVNSLNSKQPNGTIVQYFYVNNEDKKKTTQVIGDGNGTLENLLKLYDKKINENQMFTNFLSSKPQQPSLINNTTSVFSKNSLGINKIEGISGYTTTDDQKFVAVAIEKLVDDIRDVRRSFEQQRNRLENDVEKKMNEIVRNKKNGFGFEPTIRNIFAVILANAEVLIRLMKDVHRRAIDQADTRKKVVGEFSKESKGESIYPWPELKSTILGKENTIIYPGDPDFHVRLGSDNPVRWPEVEFIETYIGISTNKVDSLTNKESGVDKNKTQFETDTDVNKIKKINTANSVTNILPYVNKTPSSFVYEIYERALTYNLVDTFNKDTIKELANIEFQNILESVKGDNNLRKLLKDSIKSQTDLLLQLQKIAPFESYNYYLDSLPTTDYLKSFYSQSYSIKQYFPIRTFNDVEVYPKLKNNLLNYRVDDYRTNIYPFSSTKYLSYLNLNGTSVDKFGVDNFTYQGFLEIDTTQGLISGKKDSKFWVKSGYTSNLFSMPINVDNNKTNILNTPYFHKQLFADFMDTDVNGPNGRYTASAYLFLNSLPFVDLDDNVNYEGSIIMVSSLFREISTSQYVPYFLMLKWGSIYHRYKKYILEGKDILDVQKNSSNVVLKEGFLSGGTTTNINGRQFFDNQNNLTFFTNSGETQSVKYTGDTSGYTDVGIHPYYDNVFYNVVNNDSFFIYLSGATENYTTAITNGKLKLKKYDSRGTNKINYWTQYVNNGNNGYTLLPSTGGNLHHGKKQSLVNNDTPFSDNSFALEEQNNFRIIWEDEYINNKYSNETFFSPEEYNRTIGNFYNLSSNNKKVFDLIATFNPQMLEDFETHFLNFASEKVNLNYSDKSFSLTKYGKFQEVLRDIVNLSYDKNGDSDNIDTQIQNLKIKQSEKLKTITTSLLSNNDLINITIGNPKELDPHVINGFIDINKTDKFKYDTYDLTAQSGDTKYIQLYVGPYLNLTDTGNNNEYLDFFDDNNIKLSESNVLMFRSLIYIYAGYIKNGGTRDKYTFQQYLYKNIIFNSENNTGLNNRMSLFFSTLIPQFSSFNIEESKSKIDFFDGYNNKPLKVELYNFFKSMNDKWIAGNSIGQRSLLEEFLFLDKANKDIGNEYYIDIARLLNLGEPENIKQNLFSSISILLQDTGFDLRALPAYINFYGTNFSNTPKLTPSKKIAQNIFGTFLEVDYQESSPKIIVQYVGKNSTRPDMSDNKKYRFTDDSFNIGNTNNNPVMITLPKVFQTGDLSKTNKVVAFEVSFGDQNQSIFKGISLDQASIKNTTESFYVLENLARSESGSSSHNVDIGLYEYYRQAAYTCEITCMGNVMIQPTMFFYLKNIPMFKGTYWITEVGHEIRNNNIVTKFKGSRMPYTALPDLTDSFMSSYRTLFDKLQQKAINRVNGSDKVTETSASIVTADGSQYTYDMGPDKKKVPGEKVTLDDVGVTVNGIPYNGFNEFRYIVQVEYKGDKWLRAQVVRMGESNYSMNDTDSMSLITKSNFKQDPAFTWGNIRQFSDKNYFYSTRFILDKMDVNETLTDYKTLFLNPNKNKNITVNHQDSSDKTKPIARGPIDNIRDEKEYGIALSPKLMKDLDLQDGDIVYFKLEKV